MTVHRPKLLVPILALVAVFAVRAGAQVTPYEQRYGDDPNATPPRQGYLCSPGAGQWPGDDCCAQTFDGSPQESWNCANATSQATKWRNIVLLVTDDQAYCQYGFMQGVCSKPHGSEWISCTSEQDCRPACVVHGLANNKVCSTFLLTGGTPPGSSQCTDDTACVSLSQSNPTQHPDLGSCVASSDLGTCSDGSSCAHNQECTTGTCNKAARPTSPSAPPFRLNDLGCRNRQPKKLDNAHDYCPGSDALDGKNLLFDRAQAPCAGTPIEARPALITPHLDELAAEGVVFPRAYLAGIRCKNSRRAMMHGRYQRHVQYLFEDNGQGQKECPRGASNVSNRGRGCEGGDANGDAECGTSQCGTAYALGRWAEDAQSTTGTTLPNTPIPRLESQGACTGNPLKCADNGATCADNNDCPGPYVSYLFAKTENMAPGQGGFDSVYSNDGQGIGKVKCSNKNVGNEPSCLQALDDPEAGNPASLQYLDRPHFKNPYTQAFFDVQSESLYRLTEAIDGRTPPSGAGPVMIRKTVGGNSYWVQRRPFFIWFGPNLPHEGPTPDAILEGLYDPNPGDGLPPYDKVEFKHYARVSWTDAMIGGLRYHLKRSCACGADGQIHSLYENTVFIVLADHGFLPFDSKGKTTEDKVRTPMIISAPDDRAGGWGAPGFESSWQKTHRVFDDELGNAIDLLPTIIEYSQEKVPGANRLWFPGSTSLQEDYPHGRKVRSLIAARRAGTLPVRAERRDVFFGEAGAPDTEGNNKPDSGGPRYLVTRPGLFGVCQAAYTNPSDSTKKHVHPCLANADCPGGATCHCPPGSASWCTSLSYGNKWKRCVNRPDVRCLNDSDCDVSTDCPASGRCDGSVAGAYKDFAGKPCTADEQCLPPGVCQPFVLKAVADTLATGGEATITRLYDLGWSPKDEASKVNGSPIELWDKLGSAYMGVGGSGSLITRLQIAIDAFAKQANHNGSNSLAETWNDPSADVCPVPFCDWDRTTGGGLWWNTNP